MPSRDQIAGLDPDSLGEIDTAAKLAAVLRHLRRRLARQRHDSPLTYRELAAKTGWAHGVIGDYFGGKTLPPTDRFDVLVRLIGANPAEQGLLATARDRVEELRRTARSTGLIRLPRQSEAPVPRELPPDVSGFAGRTAELGVVDALLRPAAQPGPGVICAIDGVAGVGKSALAIHAAHRLADRFADGQLYVDLQGVTHQQSPLSPTDALTRLLHALGVVGGKVPDNEVEASAMFRALAADRRLLILLDNADGPGQLRPLLPASPTCAVLVTSRRILATLNGATHLHLDVLSAPEALALLAGLAGRQRLADDPAAADKLVQQCDCLPLALRAVGARLAARPRWPIRTLTARMADGRHRLDELRHGDLAVRTSFQTGYRMLTEETGAARAFPLLALLDGADVSLPVAACLLDQAESDAESNVECLVDVRLLESALPGRYRYHDLLRLFARELVEQHHTPQDRTDAIVRAMNWYVTTSRCTFRLLRAGERRAALEHGQWEHGGLEFADVAAALDWLETERLNLLAAIPQAVGTPGVPAEVPIALAQALGGFFQTRCHWQDWIMVNHTVLALAHRVADRAAEAQACSELGAAYKLRGQYDDAVAHLRTAQTIFHELNDGRGEAACLNCLGDLYDDKRLPVEAKLCFEESLAISRETADRYGQAVSMNHLGLARSRENRYEQARAYCQEALDIFGKLANPGGQARALNHLASVHRRQGQHAPAIACLERSLIICRRLGDRYGEGRNLLDRARIAACQEQFAEAMKYLRKGLSIQRTIGARRDEAECLSEIGYVLAARGEQQQARRWWKQALAILDELGVSTPDTARALLARGDTPSGCGSANQPQCAS